MMRTLNDYMTMDYHMEIVEDKDEGGFVVSFPELPGCITCGETVESAVANALDAKKAWLEATMENSLS
jgi:predicted RNase H-like HicB family nuclease